jgi:hypothetical protein
MLDCMTSTRSRGYCDGLSRRGFLQVGSLALGGLALPQLLAARAEAAGTASYLHDRSVVLLFLSGGPSHIEFFDPKMTAPSEIHSITGEVKTKIPGVTFGGTFPQLAAMTDQISVVRSYGTKNSGHTYARAAGGDNPMKATMSAIYSRVAGTNDPQTGLPKNILVKPEAVKDGLKLGSNFETGALPTLTQAGDLGKSFAAFDSSGGGALKDNMELRLPRLRLGDRRVLLQQLDQIRFNAEKNGTIDRIDRYRQQAFEIITRGIGEAFDMTKENPKTIARYDTTGIFKAPDLQRYYDMRRSTNLLGHQLLLARRLCEAGCGFVTVSDCGWDMHANNNSPKGMAGMWPMGQQVDHAVAAFIDDCRERGLSDKILLIVTGEMGRTPRINGGGGRNHYGELTPLLFSGGGLQMGQVIGGSDGTASRPIDDGYQPSHLVGTVMNSLFDTGNMRLDPKVPREILRIINARDTIAPLHA